MIGDSLTLENLTAIYQAMQKIKPIDRSLFFESYLKEVIERINRAKYFEQLNN